MAAARLGRLRSDADAALAVKDGKAERRVADRIVSLYRGRPDLRWGLDRLRTHRGDVLDPQALLALTEREVVAPLDAVARRVITRSAKRVATVTALAPLASIAFGYVVFENIGLLRRLAALRRPAGPPAPCVSPVASSATLSPRVASP